MYDSFWVSHAVHCKRPMRPRDGHPYSCLYLFIYLLKDKKCIDRGDKLGPKMKIGRRKSGNIRWGDKLVGCVEKVFGLADTKVGNRTRARKRTVTTAPFVGSVWFGLVRFIFSFVDDGTWSMCGRKIRIGIRSVGRRENRQRGGLSYGGLCLFCVM